MGGLAVLGLKILQSRTTWAVLGVIAVLVGLGLALDRFGDGRYAAGQRDQKTADQAALDAAAANVATVKGNWGRCVTSLNEQSALVAQRSAEDAAQLKASAQAVAEADARTRAMAAKVAQVGKPLTGVDQCARVLEVDQRLMDALK